MKDKAAGQEQCVRVLRLFSRRMVLAQSESVIVDDIELLEPFLVGIENSRNAPTRFST